MIPPTFISHVIGATIGAGVVFIFAVQPQQQPPCEPIEMVRFVGQQPEIHIIESNAFGVSQDAWLTQFASDEPVVAQEEDEPVRPRRWRRRHGRS